MALGAGAVLALGHSPYDFPWGGLLALPLIFVLWSGVRRAALAGWLVGLGYFAVSLSWIVEPFLVDIARHGWMAPFALVFLAGGLALFWAFGFGLAKRVAGDRVWGVLALAGSLSLTELTRAWILTGFPWALPGYLWADTPVVQVASVLGPHGLGLIVLTLGFLLGLLRIGPVLVTVAGFAALWGFGTWRLAQPVADTDIVVRLVQPNAVQHLKWDPEWMPQFYNRQLAATAAPAARAPDVILWPETAVPFLLGTRADLFAQIANAPQNPKARVILGLRRHTPADGWYNTLAALAPDGTARQTYDKHHLVPFGEYLPLRPLFDAIGLGGFVGSFQPGLGPRRITLDGLPPFQPLICYEAIFPHEVLRGARRPDWLLQITNDAWFGTWSGPYQHLAQARLRAIEQGLPLARSANTGVSAMIDPFGRVVIALPLGADGFVDAPLPAPLAPTPYARSGELLVLGLILAWLAVAMIAGRRRG